MEAYDEITVDFHPLTTPNDDIIHNVIVDELGMMKLLGTSIVVALAWWMKNQIFWEKISIALSCGHGRSTLHLQHVDIIHPS